MLHWLRRDSGISFSLCTDHKRITFSSSPTKEEKRTDFLFSFLSFCILSSLSDWAVMAGAKERRRPMPDDRHSDNDENDSDFVESDPTGRYGRYNEVLGKGAFKTVYKAFDEVDGIEVAWNQVKVQDLLQSCDDLERLYSEVHLLKTLKHKNIIKFYNSWVDPQTKNVNFITEIFTSGTLRQYRKRHKHVDMKAVKNWSRQILRGLLYLHNHDPPIIHRDLKCDNIFINGNHGEVKIGDLGLATILRQAHAAHSVIGTPEFMAPELYEEEYNELVDIYSFGMCLLEMITSEYPYSECANAAQIYKKVTAGKKPAAFDKLKDPQVRRFVEKCLAPASERIPARELLMHPFLQSDGDHEATDSLSCAPKMQPQMADLQDLGTIPEEPDPKCSSRGSSDVRKETRPALLTGFDEQKKTRSASLTRKGSGISETLKSHTVSEALASVQSNIRRSNLSTIGKPSRTSLSSHVKEELSRRNRDFRVKGKRQDDKKILFRIRIAGFKGGIRNIRFEFDMEVDTAISVASEMVAELDLSDQDARNITEMIDTEIMALVPEWRPGVTLDDGPGDDTLLVNQCSIPAGDNLSSMQREVDCVSSGGPANVSRTEAESSGDGFWSMSPKSTNAELSGLMYGRFEEVGCSTSGSDIVQQELDKTGFSSDLSDGQEEADGHNDNMDVGYISELHNVSRMTENLEKVATQIEDPVCQGADGEAVAEELRLLTVQQEQEIQDLRQKHEQAVVELKARLLGRGCHANCPLHSKMLKGDVIVVTGEESQQSSRNLSGSLCLESLPRTDAIICHTNPVTTSNILLEPDKLPVKEPSAAPVNMRGLNVNGFELVSSPQDLSGVGGNHADSEMMGDQANVLSLRILLQKQLAGNFLSMQNSATQPDELQSEMSAQSNTADLSSNMLDASNDAYTVVIVNQLCTSPRILETTNRKETVAGSNSSGRKLSLGKFDTSSYQENGLLTVSSPKGKEEKSLSACSTNEGVQVGRIQKEVISGEIHRYSGDASCKVMPVKITPYKYVCEAAINKDESRFTLIDSETTHNLAPPYSLGLQMESNFVEARVNSQNQEHAPLDLGKSERMQLIRRESYLELYKGGLSQKDRLQASKVEGKTSDVGNSQEISGKSIGSKNNPSAIDQLKWEQLQKSIAELEAKTLEGLCNTARKHAGGHVQGVQPGPSTGHVRQLATSEVSRVS